jgi:hypothetical protein
MCQNLDLRFLPFIDFCQVFFPAPFHFFNLVFYCLFSFFDLFFYHPLFSPFFFTLVLSLFFWLMWFHLYPTPTCLGIKSLVVVVGHRQDAVQISVQLHLQQGISIPNLNLGCDVVMCGIKYSRGIKKASNKLAIRFEQVIILLGKE